MAITKTESGSKRRTRTPWTANPSYRRSTFPDTPKTNPWNNIFSTTLELLVAISIPNDTESAENIKGNIPFKSETIDTTIDDISSSSTDKTPGIISANTIYDKTTVNHSTAPITSASTVVPLETTFNHSTTALIPQSIIVPLEFIESKESIPGSDTQYAASENQTLSLSNQFKSYIPDISTQQDIDDELGLALSYQFMFDKRTSPWEMKDWDQDELNNFVIQAEKIDRLYHMIANDEDQNFRSWEICCRMDYKGEKYFVEMYANCDYTGFDCQGGGQICITKLSDFFLENMVTMDQNPVKIYKALLEDGYNVQEPDPLHKMHPKFWNNAPMLKYLCHNAIYKNKDILSHFKEQLPQVLANSVDDFIKVKEWENE